jgi:protein-tyrosine phosphatase
MNRSILVVARVLMAQGMTADEAIALVRDRRKGSLSDEYAEWLRSDENGFGKTALQGGGTTTSV